MLTENEYVRSALEYFDFIIKAAKVYQKKNPQKAYSAVLRRHTLLSFVLREKASECEVFPQAAEDFLLEADRNLDQAAEKFLPELEKIARKNAAGAQGWKEGYPPGMSLKWEGPHPDLPENWCLFHMWNGISPKSFLSEKQYFARNFMTIMEESQKKAPFDTLYTYSWLNSSPRFLEFFPQEWHDNRGERHQDVFANLGFLGQFVCADGRLNQKTAQLYLESGELPCKPCASHCSFGAMKKHLKENFL